PAIVTAALVTSIVCTTLLSDTFRMRMLPVPFTTVSENVRAISVAGDMPVASSGGFEDESVGGVSRTNGFVLRLELSVLPGPRVELAGLLISARKSANVVLLSCGPV